MALTCISMGTIHTHTYTHTRARVYTFIFSSMQFTSSLYLPKQIKFDIKSVIFEDKYGKFMDIHRPIKTITVSSYLFIIRLSALFFFVFVNFLSRINDVLRNVLPPFFFPSTIFSSIRREKEKEIIRIRRKLVTKLLQFRERYDSKDIFIIEFYIA